MAIECFSQRSQRVVGAAMDFNSGERLASTGNSNGRGLGRRFISYRAGGRAHRGTSRPAADVVRDRAKTRRSSRLTLAFSDDHAEDDSHKQKADDLRCHNADSVDFRKSKPVRVLQISKGPREQASY